MKKLIISLFLMVGMLVSISVPTYASTTVYDLVKVGEKYYVNNGNPYYTSIQLPFQVDFEANNIFGLSGFTMVIEDDFDKSIVEEIKVNPVENWSRIFISNSGWDVEIENLSTGSVLYGEVNTDQWDQNYKIYFKDLVFADLLEPVLNGETAFVTNVDNPISESEIRSYITALDETDGDISHRIVVESTTYDHLNATVGTKTIVYSVTDEAGNKSTLTVTVLVKDVTAPGMSLSSWSQSISYSKTLDVEALKNSIQKSDNVDSASGIAVTILSNTYTTNKSKPGVYKIQFQAQDSSGNKTVKDYTVTVIDDIKPIASYNSVIMKPATSALTVSDIMSEITATDVIDGNVTSSLQIVSDGYTGNGNKVGEYVIRFSVKDKSNNVLEFDVTVKVLDNIPPVFYVVPGYFIRVEDVVSLTLEDFVDILTRTGQIQMSGTTTYTTLLNEYEGNEMVPGTYAMSLKFRSTSGLEEVKSFAVQVMETEASDGEISEEKDNFILVAIDWLKNNKVYTVIILTGILLSVVTIVIFSGSGNRNRKYNKYSKYRK
ncbi:MAG: hypothetical protein RBQ91_05960 [Acholeplasma sp.]|nr:hypothetical protein [Acholeplasma sp.]